jgi:signal transduction histidine kinase
MPSSIKTRLSAGLALSLVLLMGTQWLLVTLSLERLLEEQLATRLSHDAESLLAGMQFDTAGAFTLDPDRVNLVYQRPLSGHYYSVRSGTAEQVSRSLWDATLALTVPPVGESERMRVVGPRNQSLFVLAESFRKQGHDLTIAVAEDTSALDAQVRQFTLLYALVSAAVLLLLLWMQRVIVGRGLYPLERVRAEMLRLQRGETNRVSVAAPEEISPLVTEVNRMLAAVTNRTQRSRVALGNLAHALKTQLAVLSQIAARPELHRAPELRRALEAPIEAIRGIVERELRRARVSGASMPGRRVALIEELTALSNTLQQIYSDKALRFEMDVPADSHFDGDREDLLEMLGNLLDNACKWSRSRVKVSATRSDGLTLRIDDDGPGCSEDQLDDLTRRGFRIDESLPGSGLGLAIVKDVVNSYEGQILFCRSPELGGLRVELRFPPAPTGQPQA